VMRSFLALCALLVGISAAQAGVRLTTNDPFVFGMTKDEVERVAEAPLIYLSGPRGSERYMIDPWSTVPAAIPYPVDTGIVLQFRRGRLTGWRRDWQMRPFWF